MSGYIDICPGADLNNPADKTAKRAAWIGRNPDNLSQTGAYFRGPLWIGGTNTGNAPIVTDSTGNLSITGGSLIGVNTGVTFSGDAGGSVRINNSGAPGGPIPLDVIGKVRSSTGFRVGSADGATGHVTFTGSVNGVNGIIQPELCTQPAFRTSVPLS